MKTIMTISLEEELKKSFTDFAKSLGTNPTNLLCMMMKNSISSKEISFTNPSLLDLEIEPFSEEEIEDLMKDKSIRDNMKKLENIF